MKINATITYPNDKNLNRSVELDTETLPDSVMRYLLEYGLQQSVNDAGAGASADPDKGPDDAFGLKMKRFEQLKSGEIPAGGRSSDPLGAEIRNIAENLLKTRADYKKADSKAKTQARNAFIEANRDALKEQAKANLAALDDLKSLIVKLDD